VNERDTGGWTDERVSCKMVNQQREQERAREIGRGKAKLVPLVRPLSFRQFPCNNSSHLNSSLLSSLPHLLCISCLPLPFQETGWIALLPACLLVCLSACLPACLPASRCPLVHPPRQIVLIASHSLLSVLTPPHSSLRLFDVL